MGDDDHALDTLHSTVGVDVADQRRAVALTIAYHPELDRVGDRALLSSEALRGRGAPLSRTEPDLFPPGSSEGRALDDRHLSRTPWTLTRAGDDLVFERGGSRVAVRIDGDAVAERGRVGFDRLDDGVVIELGDRVVLVLHLAARVAERPIAQGIVGPSDAMVAVRAEIARVAGEPVSVLVQGESGVGKELVARAIHDAGLRRRGPFVAVNMAAVPTSTAVSELFGHEKGAFTGAVAASTGFFGQAEGGTLFLDEIGLASHDVQAMLLRVLESGEAQPVGGPPRKVDVRVLAATDADLARAATSGQFRLPLLHRLAAYEIVVSPLRKRRVDIAPLLLHFLRAELGSALTSSWLPPTLVARLVRHPWPGNVRQLYNVARQLAITSRGHATVQVGPVVSRILGEGDAPGPVALVSARPARTDLDAIADEEVVAALERARWSVAEAARALGVSKSSMYQLMERTGKLRTGKDLSRDEILDADRACDGDLTRMSEVLRVPRRGLKLRMTELDLAVGRRRARSAAGPRTQKSR